MNTFFTLFTILLGLFALFAQNFPPIPLIALAITSVVIWSLKRKRILLRFGACGGCALLLLGFFFLASPPEARAVETYSPNFYKSETNYPIPVTLTNTAAISMTPNTTNTTEITVKQNTGISFFCTLSSTNTSSVSVVLGFDVSANGSTFTSTQPTPIRFTVPANFSGTNTFWTNFPASTLSNVRSIQWTTATNTSPGTLTNTCVIRDLTWSYSNQ